jgi:membrane protein YqaA with SNARE-associated domain
MIYLYAFIGIIFFNTIPFFMPATWTVLSFIAATNSINIWAMAFVAAVGATIGRILLATFSRDVIRSRFLTERARQNIDSLKGLVEKHEGATVSAFLLYAFGPLPTNYLFIAYGLTTLPLWLLVAPFFIGRLASYAFWIYIGTTFGEAVRENSLFSGYFVATQVATILLVYWFTKVDWRKVVARYH